MHGGAECHADCHGKCGCGRQCGDDTTSISRLQRLSVQEILRSVHASVRSVHANTQTREMWDCVSTEAVVLVDSFVPRQQDKFERHRRPFIELQSFQVPTTMATLCSAGEVHFTFVKHEENSCGSQRKKKISVATPFCDQSVICLARSLSYSARERQHRGAQRESAKSSGSINGQWARMARCRNGIATECIVRASRSRGNTRRRATQPTCPPYLAGSQPHCL